MGKNSKDRRDRKKEREVKKTNRKQALKLVKKTEPELLILRNGQSPGDGVMLAFAVASLKKAYPDRYKMDVDTPYNDLFEGLYPEGVLHHLSPEEADQARVLETAYDTVHKSNQHPYFYITGMLQDLETKLGIPIPPAEHKGFIPIRDEEKAWYSAPREILGKDVPYWVVNAGWKNDYTAKQWSTLEYQKLIDMFPNEYFVQVGVKGGGHNHPELRGDNLINLVGKTDLRQLIRLIWNAYGVITPCSMAMLLSYALPSHPRYRSKSRACIAITGGREPNHWHQGPNIQYMHTCGMLPCCDNGGCWRSRVEKLNDGEEHDNSLCYYPVKTSEGQTIARCMSMITADDVARHMERYISNRELFQTY